jgi:hypothetical protein
MASGAVKPRNRGVLRASRDARWCSLVMDGRCYVESNGQWSNESRSCMTYHVFYTEEFMREQFPHATIRPRSTWRDAALLHHSKMIPFQRDQG